MTFQEALALCVALKVILAYTIAGLVWILLDKVTT